MNVQQWYAVQVSDTTMLNDEQMFVTKNFYSYFIASYPSNLRHKPI